MPEAQSPPKELEVGPHSGPYLLVYLKLTPIKFVLQFLLEHGKKLIKGTIRQLFGGNKVCKHMPKFCFKISQLSRWIYWGLESIQTKHIDHLSAIIKLTQPTSIEQNKGGLIKWKILETILLVGLLICQLVGYKPGSSIDWFVVKIGWLVTSFN